MCGRYAIDERLGVVMKDGRASVAGAMVCGRPWLCPWCSARVGQRRAAELGAAIEQHIAGGGCVRLMTLTLRHNQGQSLADVLGTLNRARAAMVRSRRWQAIAANVGLVGWIRAVEITVSERSGWHAHTHWLLFLEREPEPRAAMNWWLDLGEMWAHEVGKVNPAMAPDPIPGIGVDLRPVLAEAAGTMANYVAGPEGTASVSMELARPDAKGGRGESMTPWQVGAYAAQGDRWAAKRWAEYSEATKGVHRLRWSRGWRARLGLGRELTDQEAAEDSDDCEPVTELDDTETALVLMVGELGPRVCEAAELGGGPAVHAYLRRVLGELDWRQRCELRRWARDRTKRRQE